MPRRELLSPAQRTALLALPGDEGEFIRHFTLSAQDMALIQQRRGDSNRLGFAVLLCHLRYPGQILGPKDEPAPRITAFVSRQLGLVPCEWPVYAERDQTRREHLHLIEDAYGYRLFSASDYREMAGWLLPLALQSDQGMVLARAVLDELRTRRIIVPPLAVIERLCAETATRALRRIFRTIVEPLAVSQREQLDGLFLPHEDEPFSVLAWLRRPVAATGPRHLVDLLERLEWIQQLELPPRLGHLVHQNRLLKLARMAGQATAQHLQRFGEDQRHALLAALLLETRATLTDECLAMHDRIIGSLYARAKRHHMEAFAKSAGALGEQIRLFATIGQVLLEARRSGKDPFAAIEAVVTWEAFEASVTEASGIASPSSADYLGLIGTSYSQIRRYAPAFLTTFEFKAAPVAEELLEAIRLLRQLNAAEIREVPRDAPAGFVPKRWQPFVYGEDGIERRYFELCLLSEMRNALRSGDLWVTGSRQFKNFEDYLLPPSDFAALKARGLPLPVEPDGERYLAERMEHLREELSSVNALAEQGNLPDAGITNGVLKVMPLSNLVPEEATAAMRRVYALLPHIRITELLLEVDRWTGFSGHFTHLKTGEPPSDPSLLLAAVLADGINLGLSKMAEACPEASYSKLAWLAAWHIRDDTYTKALAELVNAQHQQPLSQAWGEGNTSSSDGQRFRAGGWGESGGQVNLRYGTDPSVMVYTHVSDRYAPFHSQVINATARDATYVLDGLLYHESDLRIEEHYTDTAGFTDHVFGLCHLLGFRFAPRIRDLADKKLYLPDREGNYSALASLIGGTIQRTRLLTQWDEVLRLATSIRQGTVTASLMLRKLGNYPRQNGLAVALREVGRIERTLFVLQWLQDPDLRRRVQVGLNKGEARNALARAVFFNRLGEMRDRGFESQNHRASGLNLVVAAIILWNTTYIARTLEALRKRDDPVREDLVRHLSPVGWEHINLTGDYNWSLNRRVAQGELRPLRVP